jgi:catechol-2,3-dioxygenase
MLDLEGIDHVALSVSDVKRAANWYVDVLGFERRYEGMWDGIPAFVGKGTTALALFPARDGDSSAANKKHARIGMLHLAFRATRRDFLAAQTSLRERGIAFEFQDHEISHSIYFEDPEGYQLEITTYDVAV